MRLAYQPYRLLAVRHPLCVARFLMGDKHALQATIILRAARHIEGDSFDRRRWHDALEEIRVGDFIPPNRTESHASPVGNMLSTTLGKWLYCAIRAKRPEIVIETGVSHGSSSWVILNAIARNGSGRLVSFDLPDHDTNEAYNLLSARMQTGWIVPRTLRDRWELILGPAQQTLPSRLQQLGVVDFFFHDSDHSYEHMLFEFETVFPHVRKGGLIVSDDVHKNSAFSEFVRRRRLTHCVFRKGGTAQVTNL